MKYAHWIAIAVAIFGAAVANLRIPVNLESNMDWLYGNIVAQQGINDTLAAKQDSLGLAMATADSSLQAEMKSRTKVLADSTISLRALLTKLQKSAVSAGRVKKVEDLAKGTADQIKVTAKLAEFTEAELKDLRETFRIHQELRPKDAHGDKKLAQSNSGKQVSSAASSWGAGRKGKNF